MNKSIKRKVQNLNPLYLNKNKVIKINTVKNQYHQVVRSNLIILLRKEFQGKIQEENPVSIIKNQILCFKSSQNRVKTEYKNLLCRIFQYKQTS